MKKGFTLIELLAVIVILAVIALIATPIILGIISDSKKSAFKDTAYGIIEAAKNEYISEMYKNQNPSNITFTYINGAESSSIVDKSLNYNGTKPLNGSVILTKNGDVAIALHDGTNCVYKNYSDSEVTIEAKTLSECTTDYSVTKGVNAPRLAEGMTPIKWNGITWIETTVSDKDWYSYDTTNKKWANAKTADGSMWVWIPRYVYKITENHHVNTTGTIVVQFSKGINDDWNGVIDTGTTADASKASINGDKYTDHPAFWWDKDSDTLREEGEELTGIWVAKFEVTKAEGVANGYYADWTCPITGDNDSTKTVKVVSGIRSWRCITIGNAFTAIRNMETKNVYGWTIASNYNATTGVYATDTNNLDTHLMKNIEWGAVAYLSKSQYGKNTEEIYINNNQNYITGCAGSVANAGQDTNCSYSYEKLEGQKASTTGTIYGIYDMSGGAWERVAAYIPNDYADDYGATIVTAASKYKDVYGKGATDDQANNYALTINKKGDAVWETSNNINGAYSWFSDYSYMPNASSLWFLRGGNFTYGSSAGAFNFYNSNGYTNSYNGFRPVLAVGSGF